MAAFDTQHVLSVHHWNDTLFSFKTTRGKGLRFALDRAMLCGSPAMLRDTRAALDALGFAVSPGLGQPGDYVIERAFVER